MSRCWVTAPATCKRPVPILALVLRIAAISLTALAVVLIACSTGDGEPTPTSTAVPAMTVEEAASRGPYGVGVTTLEFVDETRPTAPNGDYAGAPTRTFPTEVWYPAAASTEQEVVDAPLERSGGPYPLIVFAHGALVVPTAVGVVRAASREPRVRSGVAGLSGKPFHRAGRPAAVRGARSSG